MNKSIPMKSVTFKDLEGCTFNQWTVLSYEGKRNNASYWLCRCSCGTERVVRGPLLYNNKSKCCGCSKGKPRDKHGSHISSNPAYIIWRNMRHRCYYPKDPAFLSYGGRGITVCERWNKSFKNFIEDMGCRPSSKHSIDRVDNNKGYCKENCRWATYTEQNRNRRDNIKLKVKKEYLTAREVVERIGGSEWTVRRKIKQGNIRKIIDKLT